MISARDHVEHLAELDALAFVEGHGAPFEAGGIGEAFVAESWPAAIEDAGLTDEEAATLLPIYRRALRLETRKLAGIGD